jgi:hypothetical protein
MTKKPTPPSEKSTARGKRTPPRKPVTIDLPPSDVAKADDGAAKTKPSPVSGSAPKSRATDGKTTPSMKASPSKQTHSSPPASSQASSAAGLLAAIAGIKASARVLGFALVGGMVALAAIYGLNRFGQSDADAVLADKLASNDRELANLKAQIQTAVAAIKGLPDGERLSAQVTALGRKVNGHTTRLGALGEQTAAITALEARLSAVSTDISALNKSLSAGTAGADVGLATLDRRLQAVETELMVGRQTLAKRVDDLTTQLDRLAAVAADPAARPQSEAVLAIAVYSLEAAVRAGRRYRGELAVVHGLARNKAELSALQPSAGTGVATTDELSRQFQCVREVLLAAGPKQPAGVADKLISGLGSLITIRRRGPVEGDSRQAIVSRIDAYLASGDSARARAQWDLLDDAAKSTAADWGAGLIQRDDALAAIDKMKTDVLTALSAAGAKTE